MSTIGEGDPAIKSENTQDDAKTDADAPPQQPENERNSPAPQKPNQAPAPPRDVAPPPPTQQSHEPPAPPRLPLPGGTEDLGRTWSETIFPMKLYDILCNPEFHHAISWMPHGRSWKVLNKEFFMEEICPQYFAQTRYESFIRQVNGWGFKRMRREGPDRSSYYHEHFLRGYPNLIDHMRRPAPGEKTRDMREEPDFYASTPMPQLPPSVILPSGGGARAGKLSKVGRPPGSLNGMGGAGRGSFDAVPPRGEYPGPYGHGPYMMPPGASPWGPSPYYPYPPPPPPGYWGQHPPQSSPWRGGAHPQPPQPHHGHYPYPPMGWGPPPPGTGVQPPNGPPPPMTYPYPPGMYDPNYYGGYPHHPSTPQHGGRAVGDSVSSGSKRDREENPEDSSGESPNKRHHPPPPHSMASSGPLPPPHMSYYYPPAHMIPGEMTPRKEEGGEEHLGSFGRGPPGSESGNQEETTSC